MVVDLGVAPYDAIPQLIAARTSRLSYRAVRMIWDISMLSAGFLLGSTVGLTTLITGFFLGPAIMLVSNVYTDGLNDPAGQLGQKNQDTLERVLIFCAVNGRRIQSRFRAEMPARGFYSKLQNS